MLEINLFYTKGKKKITDATVHVVAGVYLCWLYNISTQSLLISDLISVGNESHICSGDYKINISRRSLCWNIHSGLQSIIGVNQTVVYFYLAFLCIGRAAGRIRELI